MSPATAAKPDSHSLGRKGQGLSLSLCLLPPQLSPTRIASAEKDKDFFFDLFSFSLCLLPPQLSPTRIASAEKDKDFFFDLFSFSVPSRPPLVPSHWQGGYSNPSENHPPGTPFDVRFTYKKTFRYRILSDPSLQNIYHDASFAVSSCLCSPAAGGLC